MRLIFTINDIEINEPNNYPELFIEANYNRDSSVQSVSVNNWEFGTNSNKPNDAVKLIKKHIQDGLIAGVGVGEGLPLKIDIDNEKGKRYNIFDGYINTWTAEIWCDRIVAETTETGRIDWLNTVADSFTFDYLNSLGLIPQDKIVYMPYCVDDRQNKSFKIFVTTLSIFVMTWQLKKELEDLKNKIAGAANPFESYGSIIGIILQIVYIATLILAIAKLLVDLFNLVVQPVKYHTVMKVTDMLEIGLEYLGLKLSSSILQKEPFNKLYILPEKYYLQENIGRFENILGLINPAKGQPAYFRGTFGDLLRQLKEMFNAKIQVIDGVLYFERQNWNLTTGSYTIPLTEEQSYKFNHEEFYSNIKLGFTLDSNDRYTYDNYGGNVFQVQQLPTIVTNKRMRLLKNYKNISLQFSRATRKNELNKIEKTLDRFLNFIGGIINGIISVVNVAIRAINAVISVWNRIVRALRTIGIRGLPTITPLREIQRSQLSNLIDNRIGVLVLENDYVNVPKLMILNVQSNPRNTKIATENDTFINAKYLYENYHYFNNFVTTNDWNNQGLIYEVKNIPFTFDDYEKVRTNGVVNTWDGREARLLSLKFNPINQIADIEFKVPQIYTNNITLKTLYPND
jgi:hypothetical protein